MKSIHNTRSWLFIPGDQERFFPKIAQVRPEAIIYDLEDSIQSSKKTLARENLKKIEDFLPEHTQLYIRVNPIEDSNYQKDLGALLLKKTTGIVLPKVQDSLDVLRLQRDLENLESQQNTPQDSLKIVALIESPRGVLNIGRVAKSSPRLTALMFGAEDYSLEMGISNTPQNNTTIDMARWTVSNAAAGYSLQSIDMVFTDIKNPEGFIEEAEKGNGMGYTGKALIHPSQVDLIKRVYQPDKQEIEEAEKLLAAYDLMNSDDRGAFQYKGKMVDMPVILKAKRIIEMNKH